ncbi:MAG TPA: hypothetical protein VNZ86_17215 [Bacteroidia bacterium]|nr:hypothetical protein [Bacteroidia bacterium]
MPETALHIKPKKGINDLIFGCSLKEAEAYFGKPEETEELEGGDDSCSLVWHFWEKGFSLFFDAKRHNLFTCVEIDHPESMLWGKKVFGLTEPELKALFILNGFKEIDMEDHEWGERRVSFDDALMDFYFEKGKMISINYGISLDQEQILILPN